MGKRIRVATLSMKGLGSIVKRRTEALLRKNKVDIAFLQETHQSEDGVNELKMNNIDIYEKNFGRSKSRGVAIKIFKYCEFTVKQVVKDCNCRFIIIQGKMGLEEYTVVPRIARLIRSRLTLAMRNRR